MRLVASTLILLKTPYIGRLCGEEGGGGGDAGKGCERRRRDAINAETRRGRCRGSFEKGIAMS